MACSRSPRYFCTMQPLMINRSSPLPFRSATSRIVSIDSCLAASMKPQVLTMTTSASSRSLVISMADSSRSWPSMISLSTRFFGQPREIIPTRRLGAAVVMNEDRTGRDGALFWLPVAGCRLPGCRLSGNWQVATGNSSPIPEYCAPPLVRHNLRECLVQLRQTRHRHVERLHAVLAAVAQHLVLELRLARVRQRWRGDLRRRRELVDDQPRRRGDLHLVDLQRRPLGLIAVLALLQID